MSLCRTLIFSAALLSPAFVNAQTLELSSSGELLDGVAAIVNDGLVLKSELQGEMQNIVTRLRAQGTEIPPANQLAPQVLERLVIQRIQLQRAERVGIQISDETLNSALANMAQRNGGSLSQLPSMLESQGIDYGAYRSEMRDQLAVEQLRQRDVIARINVTPKELDEYLERQAGKAYVNQEFEISHILVSISGNSSSYCVYNLYFI